jgi:ornithine carbamoyltransferase
MKRDLLSFALWSGEDLKRILNLTTTLRDRGDGAFRPLSNRGVGLVFERESLRTRVSFEVGIAQLGGHPVFLQQETIGIATRESVHDIGVVLSEYAALIVARTTRHQTCAQLAESSTVPLINAMTDLLHPCQILADAFTLQEMNLLSPSKRIVYIGHGNNIANSWLELAEKIPLQLVLCCPEGFEPHAQILDQSRAAGVSLIELIDDPSAAVRDADAVYTDVWPDAHGAADAGKRILQFKPFQVNRQLLRHAKPGCVIMHRLPANRGEEITSEVLDGRNSLALVQAANRMHVQKAIMVTLLGATAN